MDIESHDPIHLLESFAIRPRKQIEFNSQFTRYSHIWFISAYYCCDRCEQFQLRLMLKCNESNYSILIVELLSTDLWNRLNSYSSMCTLKSSMFRLNKNWFCSFMLLWPLRSEVTLQFCETIHLPIAWYLCNVDVNCLVLLDCWRTIVVNKIY